MNRPKTRAKFAKYVFWGLIVAVGSPAVLIGLAFAIRILTIEAFVIEGPSMEPGYPHGLRMVISRYSHGLFLPFTREQLIHYRDPAPGEPVIYRTKDGMDMFKRVVGMAGDTVEIRKNRLFRNGRSVVVHVSPGSGDVLCMRERIGGYEYIAQYLYASDSLDFGPARVPPGHVFVLGDNRDRSDDSRYHGPISSRAIKGAYLMTYRHSHETPPCR